MILDEATANVDTATDDFLKETIRSKFAGCTVLTVAHRLDSIIDSDLVIVVDEGRVVEYGKPNFLLEQKNGSFFAIAKKNGESEFERLKKITEEVYKIYCTYRN